jgi:hypothetical protein
VSHACHLHHLTARVICGEEHYFLQLVVHVSPDSRIHVYTEICFSVRNIISLLDIFFSSKLALSVP